MFLSLSPARLHPRRSIPAETVPGAAIGGNAAGARRFWTLGIEAVLWAGESPLNAPCPAGVPGNERSCGTVTLSVCAIDAYPAVPRETARNSVETATLFLCFISININTYLYRILSQYHGFALLHAWF